MSETMTEPRHPGGAGRGESGSSSSPRADGDAPVVHRAHAWKRRRLAVRIFSVLTVLAIGGLGWLGVQGYDAARKIKGGATATIVTDPAAPGFVAAVDASPVHLVAVTDDQDALSAFLVLVPDPAGGSGSIVWSLGELVIEVDGASTSLAEVYKSGGLDAARAEFEKVLGFGSTDATIVGPTELADAAAGLGTVSVKNPDPISVEVKGKKVEKFKAGAIELAPDELGEYLTLRGAGERPENRSTRAEALLTALQEQLGGSGETTTGGPTTAAPSVSETNDLGTLVTRMGTSSFDFIVLPTTRQSFKGSYLYSPDPEAITEQLNGVVQFPVSSFPGQRPRVRVLNGTTDTTMASRIAPDLARAGGEVLLVGNAKSLDVGSTTVVYSNDEFKGVADAIAEAVGVSAERTDEISDAADIDVVLGADHQP